MDQRQRILSQLVEARLEKGISQAELARRISTQPSNISRLENGAQNPSLDMILRIAYALGKDVSLSLIMCLLGRKFTACACTTRSWQGFP